MYVNLLHKTWAGNYLNISVEPWVHDSADSWRSRSSWHSFYLWSRYCCGWHQHHNSSLFCRFDHWNSHLYMSSSGFNYIQFIHHVKFRCFRWGSLGAKKLEREACTVLIWGVQVLQGLACQVWWFLWYMKIFYFSYAFSNYQFTIKNTLVWTNVAICSGIFLHDPVSFTALVHPEYFTFKKGVVRVETQGICTGHTLMDQGLKKYDTILFLSIS